MNLSPDVRKPADFKRVYAPKKIGVNNITITRAEGPSRLCGKTNTRTFTNYSDADRFLKSASDTPRRGGGYDKFDFKVTFTDGNTYEGRADVNEDLQSQDDILAKQMREFVAYESVSPHNTPAGRRADATFLKKYDLRNTPDLDRLNIRRMRELIAERSGVSYRPKKARSKVWK